ALPIGRLDGSIGATAWVWKNSRPCASRLPSADSAMPCSSSPPAAISASSERLTCRALRETSDMPFLWLSSSSSVIIGRNTSCSAKRNRLLGSCISTLVSRTNSFGIGAACRRGSRRAVAALRAGGVRAGASAPPAAGSAAASAAAIGATVAGCAGAPRAGRIDTTSCDAGVAAPVCRWPPGRAARASTAVEMSRRVAGLPGGFGSGMVRSIRRGESGDRSHDLQDFGDVAGHPDPAPLVRERAGAVDDERRALDPAHLAAVHVLQLHDAEALAQRFVGIGDQLVRKAELRLESVVG